jgi:hypothetical protein
MAMLSTPAVERSRARYSPMSAAANVKFERAQAELEAERREHSEVENSGGDDSPRTEA